ncbi:PssE/Cps14G family polysaccharide biosynthesis glycosyltransferase [Halobacillus sp. Cin3]|uniref:PssE/Cps14G family polysaccharide biosynthesis glycosyltransferase n=1 Tax=Halobacillus sp. Cin3 TaxID=2928441 RepID=UPI00248DE5DF|nr:PssE/Cps14G family polysaccharide biosynthesis glycosyltransferase [Halobacillus sp. Cin3]
MIFVTVGTQKFPFDRLVKALDLNKKEYLNEEIYAQIGSSKYKPENFDYIDYLTSNDALEYIKKSEIVITHAGTSSIIHALREKKKIIVVPRQKRYGEHVDNHQLEICKAFASENYIEELYDVRNLTAKIKDVRNKKYNEYNFDNDDLLTSIRAFIYGG